MQRVTATRRLLAAARTLQVYPDFIAELTDARLLVIEYKCAHLVPSDETKEEVAVGL
jgi:hypothetical protein